jgi:hypothetical protein
MQWHGSLLLTFMPLSIARRITLFISFSLYSSLIFSASLPNPGASFHHPLYIGVSAGYGSTTWEGLVPAAENQNMAISISTPLKVREGGAVFGFWGGYELSRYFAIEANYTRYPKAIVFFDEESLFAFEHDELLELTTNTETAALMAKVMINIPTTTLRFYSSLGAAMVRRWDMMNDSKRAAPAFGAGFNYNASEHLMAEIGFNYTAGYGESELNPAKDYIPFLYSVFLRLAYRV